MIGKEQNYNSAVEMQSTETLYFTDRMERFSPVDHLSWWVVHRKNMLFRMCVSKNEGECIHITNKEDKKIFIEEQVEIHKTVGSIKKYFPLWLVPGSLLFSWICFAVE